MRAATRTLIDGVLIRTPAQPIFARRATHALAVIAYHEVSDELRFVAQLDHLRRFARPVTLEEVGRAAEGRGSLPKRAVLVTFDDGHRDVLETAMPLLKDRGIPAVAFVVAGLIGTSDAPWWTEVKERVREGRSVERYSGLPPEDLVRVLKRLPDGVRLAAIDELRGTGPRAMPPVPQLTADELRTLESAGVAIGNHSLTHPCLSRCEPEKVLHEIQRSHEILTDILGHEPDSFAYPDGDRSPAAAEAVGAFGYRTAFLFDHRLSLARPPDPLAISRLRVDAHAAYDRFRIIVSGLHPAVHRLRGLN